MTIGEFLKQKTGLSNHKIAQKLEPICCRGSVYNILNNKQTPSVYLFLQICKKLEIQNITVSTFIFETYNKL